MMRMEKEDCVEQEPSLSCIVSRDSRSKALSYSINFFLELTEVAHQAKKRK